MLVSIITDITSHYFMIMIWIWHCYMMNKINKRFDLFHVEKVWLTYQILSTSQTGLSGSSAIVSAALSCLLDFYKVRHLIKVEVRPNLVLNAEKELGIVAGLQDRVAQVYGGVVYMVCMCDTLFYLWQVACSCKVNIACSSLNLYFAGLWQESHGWIRSWLIYTHGCWSSPTSLSDLCRKSQWFWKGLNLMCRIWVKNLCCLAKDSIDECYLLSHAMG